MSKDRYEFWDGVRWSTITEDSAVIMDMDVLIACGKTLQVIADIGQNQLNPNIKLVTTIRQKAAVQMMHGMWHSNAVQRLTLDDIIRCPTCNGRGLVDDGRNGYFATPNQTCGACHGKGFVKR